MPFCVVKAYTALSRCAMCSRIFGACHITSRFTSTPVATSSAPGPGVPGERQRQPDPDDGNDHHDEHQPLRDVAARELGIDHDAEVSGRQAGAEVLVGDVFGEVAVGRFLRHHIPITSAKASPSALCCRAHMSA
jgi:hypothetical protein